MNELESGIIPLLFKEGNVSALKQSVNSFTRSDALGYVRIDLRVRRDDNAIFVHDVNPNPAFTAGSAYVFAAEASGRDRVRCIRDRVRFSRDHGRSICDHVCSIRDNLHEVV